MALNYQPSSRTWLYRCSHINLYGNLNPIQSERYIHTGRCCFELGTRARYRWLRQDIPEITCPKSLLFITAVWGRNYYFRYQPESYSVQPRWNNLYQALRTFLSILLRGVLLHQSSYWRSCRYTFWWQERASRCWRLWRRPALSIGQPEDSFRNLLSWNQWISVELVYNIFLSRLHPQAPRPSRVECPPWYSWYAYRPWNVRCTEGFGIVHSSG